MAAWPVRARLWGVSGQTGDGAGNLSGRSQRPKQERVRSQIRGSYLLIDGTNANGEKRLQSLSNKIIKGGGGSWGDAIMTAPPQLTSPDASEIVKYILTLSDNKVASPSLPTQGTYIPKENEKGILVLQASYKDKGANGLPPQMVEQVLMLAEFSFAGELMSGKMTNMDFPARTKKNFGINILEYVSMFFNNKHTDQAYLKKLKQRCDDLGMTNNLLWSMGQTLPIWTLQNVSRLSSRITPGPMQPNTWAVRH